MNHDYNNVTFSEDGNTIIIQLGNEVTSKITFTLPTALAGEVKAYAAAADASISRIVRQSIEVDRFFRKQEDLGKKFFLQLSDGTTVPLTIQR
jgi:hypothetical protein